MAIKTELGSHYTSPQHYTDIDGQSKSFTMIDYDVKPKLTMPITSTDIEDAKEAITVYRKELIERILALPASNTAPEFYDFTLRGETAHTIKWNETMLRDPGLSVDRLRAICTLTERINNL